jgi:hypothetical protein
LNDCHSTRVLLQHLLHPGDPPTRNKKLLGALDRRENDLFEKYRAYWHETLESPEYREKFMRYLTHPPRQPPKKAVHAAKSEAAA